MSNLGNLFRDQLHANLEQGETGFANNTTAGDKQNRRIEMNSTGVVNDTFGLAYISNQSLNAQSKDRWRGAGVLIAPPIVDDTPYRVKAYAAGDHAYFYVFVGYAPVAANGNSDVITKVNAWPISQFNDGSNEGGLGYFDEIIKVPGVAEGDPEFGKPIAIGVAMSNLAGSDVQYSISVQNLAKTAPKFAASIS